MCIVTFTHIVGCVTLRCCSSKCCNAYASYLDLAGKHLADSGTEEFQVRNSGVLCSTREDLTTIHRFYKTSKLTTSVKKTHNETQIQKPNTQRIK